MLNELLKIIPEFDVISFDIFDTLLLRTYFTPSDLWKDMEIKEGALGFAEDRYKADRKLYALSRENGREPIWDEVYAEIPQWKLLKEKELVYERMAICANPEMLDVWEKAGQLGKKRIITSDMYLPQSFLENILEVNGISGWDGFYLSNARQLKKRDGGLFKKIIEEQGYSATQILHIGDNEEADYSMPKSLGIVAYLYPKVIDKFLCECPFIRGFVKNPSDIEKRRLTGCLAIGWHRFKCKHSKWSYWNRLGFLFAGTLGYIYMRFVGEEAKQRGITHLMMVARDCYILEKIFNMLYPEIRTDYFYASRISALLAMQYYGNFGQGVINRRKTALRYFREKMKLDISEDVAQHFIECGELPVNVQQIFDQFAQNEQLQLKVYFSRFDISSNNTAIVDGTSGHFTVQKLVSSTVGEEIFTFYLQTLKPTVNGKTLFQCGWDDARYLSFSEFLFCAPSAPVERIKDGKPVFIENLPVVEKIKMSLSVQIEEGALACANFLKQCECDFSKFTWLDFNDEFMDNQSLEDKEMLSIALDSLDPEHKGDFFSVICRLPEEKSKCFLGIKILTLRKERKGEHYVNILYLFGKFRLFNYDEFKKSIIFPRNFFSPNGFLRKCYRKLKRHGEFSLKG